MDENYFVIFTGRPNAGKSTCLKFLGRGLVLSPRQLSRIRIGKRAGTTRGIFTVRISSYLSLVDFPGFGRIAKRSKQSIEKMKDTIVSFIENNAPTIVLAIHLIDVSTFWQMSESLERKGIENIDVEMVNFLLDVNIPEIIVLANKIDKIATNKRNLEIIAEMFPRNLTFLPVSFRTGFNTREVKQRFKSTLFTALGAKKSSLVFKS